jgi:hypothetical protein
VWCNTRARMDAALHTGESRLAAMGRFATHLVNRSSAMRKGQHWTRAAPVELEGPLRITSVQIAL